MISYRCFKIQSNSANARVMEILTYMNAIGIFVVSIRRLSKPVQQCMLDPVNWYSNRHHSYVEPIPVFIYTESHQLKVIIVCTCL